MSRIVWDAVGDHLYETGIDRVVLFPIQSTNTYTLGVPWNGVTSIQENPSGADETKLFADNIKYLSLRALEEFGATIEAYTYPDEWAECDGSAEAVNGVMIGQQARKMFGLAYRTLIGNDTEGNDHGYKLHLIYGGTASPSQKQYQTVNDSPEAITFSWEITTTPVAVTDSDDDETNDYKPTSHIEIDSTKFTTTAQKAALKAFEDILYGTNTSGDVAGVDPRLPLPAEVITLLTVSG